MLLNWNHLISFESVDICRLDRNKIGFHHIVRVHSERLVDAHDSEKDPETTRKYVRSAIGWLGSRDSAVLGMSSDISVNSVRLKFDASASAHRNVCARRIGSKSSSDA